MSERSYRRNRSLGICGPKTSTCFPQAFDRITPEGGVSAYTYDQYKRVMRVWESRPSLDRNPNKHNAIINELYGLIAHDLGGFAVQHMVFEYAARARRLARILDTLFESSYRPVIDLATRSREVHSVGVQQIDEGLYWLVGYGIPSPIRHRPVTAEEIEPFHDNPGYEKKSLWPFLGRNISALPIPTTQP